MYGVALNREPRGPGIEFNVGMFDQDAYMRGTGRLRPSTALDTPRSGSRVR